MYDAGTGVAIDAGRALFWYVVVAERSTGAVHDVAIESAERLKRRSTKLR
jgi:hypothetical protein